MMMCTGEGQREGWGRGGVEWVREEGGVGRRK